jgi:hypothetical protein
MYNVPSGTARPGSPGGDLLPPPSGASQANFPPSAPTPSIHSIPGDSATRPTASTNSDTKLGGEPLPGLGMADHSIPPPPGRNGTLPDTSMPGPLDPPPAPRQ